uniref:TLC domain-containing protein n=1 Tax=Vitis vinifera TaxID=29760 RepID=A5BYR9_VITVI|nr:hypothetical protein VITISV_041642 [Vitis vinifera]
MEIKSYQNQAEALLKEYVLADSFIPYASIIGGLVACKMVYIYFPCHFYYSYVIILRVLVSVGYFLADLGMICWFYPSLGGMEYVVHHLLSIAAVAYAMLTGEGQLYTYMVLISETTTPGINLRWYLDVAGMKRSGAYVMNGVARILLFIYLFYHIYLHYDQVKQMHNIGLLLVVVVPSVLAVMNLMWFAKIIKGLKKTLTKRQ